MGDINVVLQAVSSVGFPIVACVFLFLQNDKLRVTIDSLKTTLTENTTLLKVITDRITKED